MRSTGSQSFVRWRLFFRPKFWQCWQHPSLALPYDPTRTPSLKLESSLGGLGAGFGFTGFGLRRFPPLCLAACSSAFSLAISASLALSSCRAFWYLGYATRVFARASVCLAWVNLLGSLEGLTSAKISMNRSTLTSCGIISTEVCFSCNPFRRRCISSSRISPCCSQSISTVSASRSTTFSQPFLCFLVRSTMSEIVLHQVWKASLSWRRIVCT